MRGGQGKGEVVCGNACRLWGAEAGGWGGRKKINSDDAILAVGWRSDGPKKVIYTMRKPINLHIVVVSSRQMSS